MSRPKYLFRAQKWHIFQDGKIKLADVKQFSLSKENPFFQRPFGFRAFQIIFVGFFVLWSEIAQLLALSRFEQVSAQKSGRG